MFTEQTLYGAGQLFAVGSDALSTPNEFGTLQDISLDISFDEKELRGQRLFAEKLARSGGKISGKAKLGRINFQMFNNIFLNGTLSAGREILAPGEAAAVPAAAGPYTIVVANAATFVTDLGVADANTGAKFDKVAAGNEATGAYSVDPATGTYTFDATDATRAVLISYTYTDAATGHTVELDNDLTGVAPTFEIKLFNQDADGKFGIHLLSCSSNKLAIPTKQSDWVIPEFDFTARANAAGKVVKFFGE